MKLQNLDKQNGFIAHMKELCPSILAVYCVVHRHHLVAEKISSDLHESLRAVIQTVNKIKSHSKYDRLFRKFCIDTEQEHVRHIEFRWLSKGNCLARFVKLFDTIVNFLKNLNENNFAKEIKLHKSDIFFLAWIFRKFNEVSLQLQGKSCTMLDCKCVLKAFAEKLYWFRINIQKKNFEDMPDLTEVSEQLSEQTRKKYENYLMKLRENFNSRFSYLFSFEVQPWMLDPFGCDIESVDKNLQEELIELKFNDECNYKFEREGITELWLSNTAKQLYPKMWSEMVKMLLYFPTSYSVKCGFSAVNKILTKERNKLDICI